MLYRWHSIVYEFIIDIDTVFSFEEAELIFKERCGVLTHNPDLYTYIGMTG